MTYDSRAPDSYTRRLGRVSEQQACIAREDVHNEFGLLLIKKGAPISPALAEKMGEHTLDQPIDEAIALENTLSQQDLLVAFNALATESADISAITEQRGAAGLLDTLCLAQPMPRVLMQKLSVMQLQLPAQFSASLFGAWLSALLALAAKWPSADIQQAFCAALFRDLGLLHIDESVVLNKSPLSKQDRRVLSVHPRVSQRILLDSGGYPKAVAQAIAEHHEHPAGIGYPAGKTSATTSKMGQLLALADLLCRIRLQRGSLVAAVPYLRTAISIYQLPIQQTAYKLLLTTEFAAGLAHEGAQSAKELSDAAIERLVSIGAIFAFLVILQHRLQVLSLDDRGEYFVQRIEQALALLRTSGLSSIDLISLLDELKDESSAELEDTELVEQEFLHIAEHIYRIGARWCLTDEVQGEADKQSIGSTLALINEVLQQCVNTRWVID